MRFLAIWAVGPLAASVCAFKDTSPFFLFSTSELLIPSQPNLVSAATLSQVIIPQLETCPTDTYVIVSQPTVQAADFTDKRATPLLRRIANGDDKNVRSSVAVNDVVGSLDTRKLSDVLKEKCGASSSQADAKRGKISLDEGRSNVIHLDFPALPRQDGERVSKLAENDAILSRILDGHVSSSYTVIYTTTPTSSTPSQSSDNGWIAEEEESEPSLPYQMDSEQNPIHIDLKRDLSTSSSLHQKRDPSGEEDMLPPGPLFESYSFLSPGLYMGILVSLILLSILYVGISAIAGLEVSYAAFDKELGPQAQKKAQ